MCPLLLLQDPFLPGLFHRRSYLVVDDFDLRLTVGGGGVGAQQSHTDQLVQFLLCDKADQEVVARRLPTPVTDQTLFELVLLLCVQPCLAYSIEVEVLQGSVLFLFQQDSRDTMGAVDIPDGVGIVVELGAKQRDHLRIDLGIVGVLAPMGAGVDKRLMEYGVGNALAVGEVQHISARLQHDGSGIAVSDRQQAVAAVAQVPTASGGDTVFEAIEVVLPQRDDETEV